MAATRTTQLPGKPARGRLLGVLVCLLSVFVAAPGRVLYRCHLTGEVLPVCCRDVEAPPPPASTTAPCCEEPEQRSSPERDDRERAGTACDCCDVVFEEGHRPVGVLPVDDAEWHPDLLAPPAIAGSVEQVRAFDSIAMQARLRAPPKRPRYLLFESFLC